jgi:hypothetical protein
MIPATNRGIKDAIKTYKQVDGEMVHDGYFLILKDAPLKWASTWQYDTLMAQTPFKRVDNAYRLTNAQ